MSKLITSDAQLRAHLPNIIASVKGETPFIEKLTLFLDLAEDWVRNTFTSEPTFNTICGYTDSNNIKILCCRLVVADALLRAIPSLDIVLTPNGFGVVSTPNLAPASSQRVDRLVASLQAHRDDCIAALLPELVGASKWLASRQAQFFGATLFPNFDIVDCLGIASGAKWEKYLELRSRIIDLEASLAEEYFSPELLTALRDENIRGSVSGLRADVLRQIQAQVAACLESGTFSSQRLVAIVNIIRRNQSSFHEWHASATAFLFTTPSFSNKKNASGYFF